MKFFKAIFAFFRRTATDKESAEQIDEETTLCLMQCAQSIDHIVNW